MALPAPERTEHRGELDATELVPGARLSGRDLTGVDLTGVDLTGADLTGAVLSGARGMRTCLAGANLSQAILDGAQLLHADLSAANLTEARAVGAAFGGCRLTDSTLFDADLSNTTLSQADLSRADLRSAKLSGARLRTADLTAVDASRADLTDADLTGAIVSDAVLHETDLHGARLQTIVGYQSADWVGSNTSQADFTGAYLARRTVIDQNYLHEFRTQSRLHEWIYRAWWLTSDCGRSYLRWAGWTLVFALIFAGLYELVEIDFGDDKTLLSSFYFSTVTLTTLGYGDVLPVSQAAQAVVITQVIIGYMMLGGLLSIVSSKMSRRGD